MTTPSYQEIIARNGEWTAMAIQLEDKTYTRTPQVDHRLKRLLQVAQDTIKKPLSSCRVLDLACLEGHYAIEFALHGAECVGIEGRAVSVAKCNFVKQNLNLTRTSFFQDDVRNLSKTKYGSFDIVICSGILYHLTAKDAVGLLQSIAEVCTGILLLDTFIAFSGRVTANVGDEVLHGHEYFEHNETDDESAKKERLWSSLDNPKSFWMTEPTLVNLLTNCGFTSIADVLTPTMPGNLADRKTYLAVKGQRAKVLSSAITNDERLYPIPEGKNLKVGGTQTPRGLLFRIAKRALPQPVKNAIKPALRTLGILPPDPTPEFVKKKHRPE